MAYDTIEAGEDMNADNIQQVIDSLSGVAGGGQPIAMTQLNDSSNYALDVQNLDGTYSYGLRVRDSASATILLAAKAALTIGKKIIATGLGTFTAAANMLDIAATWNAGAETFKGLFMNITNTASASASRLIDLQVGSVTQFAVDTSGVIYGPAWTTFTPVLRQNAGSSNVTVTVNRAAYRLIGKTCVMQIHLTVTDATNASAGQTIQVRSLPAATAILSGVKVIGGGYYNDGGTIYLLSAIGGGDTTTLWFYGNAGTDYFGVNPAITIANTDEIALNLSYEIA